MAYNQHNEQLWQPYRQTNTELAPKFELPRDITIQILPPFGGAAWRFVLHKKDRWVSVYYDIDGSLSSDKQPYFEAYPIRNDVARYSLKEFPELLADAFRELRKPNTNANNS